MVKCVEDAGCKEELIGDYMASEFDKWDVIEADIDAEFYNHYLVDLKYFHYIIKLIHFSFIYFRPFTILFNYIS